MSRNAVSIVDLFCCYYNWVFKQWKISLNFIKPQKIEREINFVNKNGMLLLLTSSYFSKLKWKIIF